MTRLVNSMRYRIGNEIMEYAYGKKNSEVEALEESLFVKVYNEMFPEQTRKLINSLPDG